MKRRLIAALIAVTALVSSSALAGVNPHILEVHLGPGGFIAKGGLKKITLGYSGPAPLRLRLNWNSDKIAVYTATNAAVPIPNEKVWDVENGEIMPTNLWVKGVNISASGPTDTTLGPEHMCLEAINNGTPYVTLLYARTEFTVVDVYKIEYCRFDLSTWVTDLNIAAGAKESNVHNANVRISIIPACAGVPIVAEASGGLGWTPGGIACVFNQTSYVTDGDGRVFGTYRSCDKKNEDATIKVTSIAGSSASIDLGTKLHNKWDCSGAYDFSIPYFFIPEKTEKIYFYPTLGDVDGIGAITTHDIRFYTKRITLQKYVYNLAYGTCVPSKVNGTYPDYWYSDPLAQMPSGFTVEKFVTQSSTTELSADGHPGVYQNEQTVHDRWDYDAITDVWTDIVVFNYDIGVYDNDVHSDP